MSCFAGCWPARQVKVEAAKDTNAPPKKEDVAEWDKFKGVVSVADSKAVIIQAGAFKPALTTGIFQTKPWRCAAATIATVVSTVDKKMSEEEGVLILKDFIKPSGVMLRFHEWKNRQMFVNMFGPDTVQPIPVASECFWMPPNANVESLAAALTLYGLPSIGKKADSYSIEEFRKDLNMLSPSCVMICNFTRKAFEMGPYGHFSAVAAYNEKEDMCLVLDTGKKFGSWWASVQKMYDGMNTVDMNKIWHHFYPWPKWCCLPSPEILKEPTEGNSRGWVIVQKK
eukprot:CAMPEP_0197621730 /NCGR_PEP_ID=MMETSP1338-20131121/2220_1 /TAXON_ID=43686 ORGANISM="Pelagodinium beii, Strain RCC1491" /NCGR_SAMPLE_ID=MMETSP1338 /ASSEMBLY_ACC=CAM_ASM_000754 /LENGTH=282 /DNA_ID=CAMNT_0043191265 /DNA_START=48 /DNA_END=896 /DNA_ORIENTATION=+